MSTRAEELAQRFEEANETFIKEVEALSDTQWRTTCTGEGWPVAVVAHHVGSGHETIARYIHEVLSGTPVEPEQLEAVHDRNAAHATRYADCSKAETVDYLRQAGATAADVVRGLTDAQLAQSGTTLTPLGERNVEWLAGFLVTHLERHRDSIRAAVG